MPVEVKNGWFELDDFFGITPLTSSRKSRKLLVKMCGEKNHFSHGKGMLYDLGVIDAILC